MARITGDFELFIANELRQVVAYVPDADALHGADADRPCGGRDLG